MTPAAAKIYRITALDWASKEERSVLVAASSIEGATTLYTKRTYDPIHPGVRIRRVEVLGDLNFCDEKPNAFAQADQDG